MIALDGIGVTLDGVRVLDGVDLEVAPGRLLALIGPSGAGKSVLLKAICGLLPVESGRITVDGEVVSGRSEEALFPVRERIGMLFQQGALFDTLSVFDNVAFPLRRRKLPEDEVAARTHAELEAVRLGHAAQLLPGEISGGMRKRVGIARALVTDPPVALYDEPTAGLDPVTGAKILRLLRTACEARGVAAIAVGHELDTLLPASDDVAMLLEGRLLYRGDAEGLSEAAHPAVRQFVTGGLEGPL
jgi:phospholipid/cholesterol/gamma-HCH transport system ATP-binding protein